MYSWKFSRVGGALRVHLESGEDLRHLRRLDQKLWTALSCPVEGLEMDEKTLRLLDGDGDGKIQVPDILDALDWLLSLINNPNELLERRTSLPLASINHSIPLGEALYESAKQILRNLGKAQSEELSIEQAGDTTGIFAETGANGDGIISASSTAVPLLQEWITTISVCMGSQADRSGQTGISAASLSGFVQACRDYLQRMERLQSERERLLPFGEQTARLSALTQELSAKVEDYFTRCRLSAFDPEAVQTLNALSARMAALSEKDLSEQMEQISALPLSKIQTQTVLRLDQGINPAWQARTNELSALLGHVKELSWSQWTELQARLQAYRAYEQDRSGAEVEGLGEEKVRAFLASDTEKRLNELIQADLACAEEVNNILSVEKLVRLYCHIYTLLCNFVTFSDFYSGQRRGIFQAGRLYFDQRSCDLCIKVLDAAKHAHMSVASGICLIYLECRSKTKGKTMTIAAGLTNGDIDRLEPGRNALFYDNSGEAWEATVTKVIEQPISIRQAFWAPYRRVAKFVSAQIQKMVAAQDEKINATATSGAESVTNKAGEGLQQALKKPEPATETKADQTPTEAAGNKTAAFDIAKFAGIFAAIGLALGAIGSVFVSFITGFLALSWWKMPLVVIAILLVISGPSMLLAWFKLRRRNLAPLLDANGWAVNAQALINIPFGANLTHLAKLPPQARLELNVPFASKSGLPVWFWLLSLCALTAAGIWAAWYWGWIQWS